MPWPRLVAIVGLAVFSCTFPDYQFGDGDAETCDNGMLDGTETQTDCGGSCAPCPCSGDDECPEQDQVCTDGACLDPCEGDECAPTCSDTRLNGEEGDVDCGHSCPTQCAVGDSCLVDADCVEKICETEGASEDKVCQPPACDDGVQNGGEAWTDCDADCPAQCANNDPCDVDADCESDTCVGGKCVRPLCDNDMEDADESDVDCGGPDSGCRLCDVGEGCREHEDCVEQVCGTNDECAEPECDDGVENGDETDEDCGADCDGCGTDAKCVENDDCLDQICNEDGKCSPPACDDEVTNGDESDLDCGDECDPCPLGDRCNTDRDCETNICDLGSDAPPRCVSCEDGKQNGSELGLDCGGSDCSLCKPGDICTDDAGCVNYLCDDGSCETGLELDFQCKQCGNQSVSDKISYLVTLRNLSDDAIDVSDVEIRYYLTAEVAESEVDYECAYQETFGCGQTRLTPSSYPTSNDATHYVRTMIGSTEPIEPKGSATVEVSVLLNSGAMQQDNDYSFIIGFQPSYQRVTLHRAGSLIWGTLPE